jgi:hypothetical protein
VTTRPSKYRNVRTEYDGRLYDSKAEAARARELDLLKEAGGIRHWEPQPKFRLGPDFTYRPDFIVWHNDGTTEVEDVKGTETPTFRKTRKLWAKYGPVDLCIRFHKHTERVKGRTNA